jgi:peptidyl-prolyl cis-trans isomerase B (cyclophilin B)
MKIKYNLLVFFLFIIILGSCKDKETVPEVEARKLVEMVTNFGTIELELYNETPLHRDNFLKLIKDKAYDSLLFHRVINQFMIQAGDPDSRKSKDSEERLGNGDLTYKVPAEINTILFHQRGALGAARDGNLERASSAMQFYIVQKGAQNDSIIDRSEKRINGWLASHYSKNDPLNKPLIDGVAAARKVKDTISFKKLNDSLNTINKNYTGFTKYKIPEAHREIYRTVGGTPHLDQNYTVFGQVIKGLSVVDSIAVVKTNKSNRPLSNVRILSVRLLEK